MWKSKMESKACLEFEVVRVAYHPQTPTPPGPKPPQWLTLPFWFNFDEIGRGFQEWGEKRNSSPQLQPATPACKSSLLLQLVTPACNTSLQLQLATQACNSSMQLEPETRARN